MRYLQLGMVAPLLALSLSNSRAGSVDVSVEAGVHVGEGNLSVGFFHDHLSPHGKWVEVTTYGRVWQPAVVLTDENWRPYVNEGHWRYTDNGWYWHSTYAWGWAPFHYGRWNYDDRYKWVWLPDVIWAPAWVSWRHSDSHYGWAPLPFGSRFEGGGFVGVSIDLRADLFNFVPAASFLSVNLGTVVLPRARVGTIYNQTNIINNSYVYNDNRVINNGIPVAQVATATKQEIKPVAIAEVKSPTEKSAADGKISAYRPVIKNEKPKSGTPQSKADAPASKDTSVPAGHVTKEQGTDPKTKAPEKDPEAKAPEKDPKAKAPEKDPEAKAPEKDPEGKGGEKKGKSKNEDDRGRRN